MEAVRLLWQQGIPATLKLVGPWPDPDYERQIRDQIQTSGLTEAVQILGRVSDDELHRHYAASRVLPDEQLRIIRHPGSRSHGFWNPRGQHEWLRDCGNLRTRRTIRPGR